MKTLALIGANGMLASAIRKLAPATYVIRDYDLPAFDLTQAASLDDLRRVVPDIIINCAALTNVDGCESQSELALKINGAAPGRLADLAREIGAVLVHISTDFIFDGAKTTPYLEEDQPGPLSVYGTSKALGEERLIASGLQQYFILRTSWLYGAEGKNFVETILRLAAEKERLTIVADQRGTPTWTDDLARAIFLLLQTDAYGIYHYSNAGECSWFEFAEAIIGEAELAGLTLRVKEIVPICTEDYPLPATRPSYSVLSKAKFSSVTGSQIPPWQESLHRYIKSPHN